MRKAWMLYVLLSPLGEFLPLSTFFIPGWFGALSPWLGVPYLLRADPHLQASIEKKKKQASK